MRKKIIRVLSLLIMVVFIFHVMIVPSTATGIGQFDQKDHAPEKDVKYATDRVIVKFKEVASTNDIETTTKSISGIKVKKKLKSNIEVVMIENDATVEEVISELQKNENVEYAEPDYWCEIDSQVDDPFFSNLWGLENDSDFDIDAEAAWDITMGSQGVVVAIIDEGVDVNHPDLIDNIWINPNEIPNDGIDNDGNGYIDDINGWDFFNNDASVYDAGGDYHGTHVAGTIAAKGNNGIGITGVAPNVKIMSLKFVGPYGGYTSDAIEAIDYANMMGVKIANNSWGIGFYSQSLREAIDNYNGVIIASAGNNGVDTDVMPNYPASYDSQNVISVAAVDSTGNLSGFSNYGINSVDLAAPGSYIYSTLPGGIYEYGSGTSMAVPHVSGVAGLLLSTNPSLSAIEICDIIKQSTNTYASLEGKVATGGLLNAYQALSSSGDMHLFVENSSPYFGEKKVALDKDILLNFSETIIESVNFGNIILTENGSPVHIECSISGSSLLISTDTLKNDRLYLLDVPVGAVVNEASIGLSEAYTLRFSTADTVAPNIIGSQPTNKATNVPITSPIVVVFDELVTDGIEINHITINGDPIGTVGFYAMVMDNLLYIWNDTTLAYNTKYKITIPGHAVVDQGGNHNEEPFTFKFVTEKDTISPQVISTNPEMGQVVPRDTKIIITFDEEIERDKKFSDIKVIINDKKCSNISFHSKIAGNQLILTPKKKLIGLTKYTVSIPARAVKDIACNSLNSSYTFNFTTE
ncbi:MAG: hypothetical protein CVU84_11890 [Firmicutes bacterium HGW-Firmicutes-1]|jgi:subtilisin family serine protease|nr:MAG: hypothetical protein CVU84_11890 [Firmicutes bacterium HGW-Firmicutes-1]